MSLKNKIFQDLINYRFGPLLTGLTLDNEFTKELSKRGKKTKIDWSKNLAGHIEKELRYEEEDMLWFLKKSNQVFSTYIDLYLKYSSLDIDTVSPKRSYKLENLWINFMKKGEFNPIHTHGGHISFVIYTSVPEEILNENRKFNGNGAGPGSINFVHGETSEFRSEHSFVPKTGNMFLFPAKLRHYVPPFSSNVVRESVSGNIYLY